MMPNSTGYLRGLAEEFNESSNSVRVELNRLEEAGMLEVNEEGNKKIYRANTSHPLYNDISKLLRRITGLDELIERVVENVGSLNEVYLVGDTALGKYSSSLNVAFIGSKINTEYLDTLILKAMHTLGKKIEYSVYTRIDEVKNMPIVLVYRSY